MISIVPRRIHVDVYHAALCDGRKRDPPLDLQLVLAIIRESVRWVTEDYLLDEEWITETQVTMKGNFKKKHVTTTSKCCAFSNGLCNGFQQRQTSTASS